MQASKAALLVLHWARHVRICEKAFQQSNIKICQFFKKVFVVDEVAKYKNVLSIQEYTHWKYVEGRLFVYEGDINLANAAFSKAIQLCEVYPQKDLLLIQRAALHRNNGFIFCNAQQIFLICWVYILVTPSCQQLIFCKKVWRNFYRSCKKV